MGKRLVAVLALALLVGATFSTAYAEVQNVKVSGDINIIGVARDNFNLGSNYDGDNAKEKNRLFGTQTRVRVDADLTDNVAATVRLINERSWNTEDNSNTDIDLDLAYVTLKEFLYSPLTLTLGRQEIRFGNQLIIGNSNNYIGTGTGNVLNGFPADLSVRNSFDAMRATLNYDPLVIDLVYSKLKNSNTNTSDDADLFGINASYDVTKDLNVQAYIWDKRDKSSDVVANSKKDNVYTLGGLATFRGIEDLVLSLEGAWQFGFNRDYTDDSDGSVSSDKRRAFALQGLADYTFSKVKFTPSIGLGYTYLSGPRDGKYAGWDPMYYNEVLSNIAYAILPFSNMQAINLRASMKPTDDVTLAASFTNYRRAQSSNTLYSPYSGTTVNTTGKKDLGNEVDLTATYDYTEDVQLGLTWGYFVRGKAFASDRGNASQLVGSMKVTF